MPSYNSRGDLLASSPSLGDVVYWTQGHVGQSPTLVRGGSGAASWLTDDEILYQNCLGPVAFLEVYDVRTGTYRKADPTGANTLVAHAGEWGAYLTPPTVTRFSTGATVNSALPFSIGDDHTAILRDWAGTRIFLVDVRTGVTMRTLAQGAARAAQHQTQGDCVWQMEDLSIWRNGVSVPVPIAASLLTDLTLVHGVTWLVCQGQVGRAYTIGLDDPSKGFEFGAENAFQPCAWLGPDGGLRLASASTAGESAGSVTEIIVNPADRVPLQPIPPPPPKKVCVPGIGKRLWMVPYWERSQRYGPSPVAYGNALLCLEPGDVAYNAPTGLPLFCTPEAYDPAWVGNIIGYWVSGGTIAELTKQYEKALKLPEKPITAYLDGRDWPLTPPSGIKRNRTWLGVQCYRNPGESVADWQTTIDALLKRLDAWGLPLNLTTQFYDRNGSQTEAQVLEILPAYHDWLVRYNCVGMMPFAVMRPGGMATYPEVGKWALGYTAAITARPERYAFWSPDTVPMSEVMRNALSQNVDYIWVDAARRAYLLGLLPPKR